MFGWLKRLFQNETSGLARPSKWLLDWARGDDTDAGVTINARTAIKLSWVYAGINRISGDCAKLPIHLHKKTKSGKERDIGHPAYYLLRYKPNPELSSFYFIRAVLYNAILHGNSYSYIFRDQNYRPIEIVPLDTSVTHPVRVDGILWYITRIKDQEKKLSPGNVFHIRGLASDGIMGLSLVDVARNAMGLGIAAERYSSTFFSSNATPTGLLEYPIKLDDEVVKRIRQQWNELHQGLDKANIAVLEKGVTFKPLAMNNDVSQLIQSRKFARQELAAILNIPPHYLGDETRTSYSSLEAEQQSYLENTLEPWLMAIEFEAWDKLLTEEEKRSSNYWFEFLREAMLKPSTADRYSIYNIGIQAGILNPNECRNKENMNARDGGDEYLRPKNMDISDGKGFVPEKDNKKPGAKARQRVTLKAHSELFRSTIERLARWQKDSVLRAARKPDKFIGTVEEFLESHKGKMKKDLEPVLACISSITRVSYDLDNTVESYCKAVFESLLEVSGSVSGDELYAAVERTVAGWPDEMVVVFAEKFYEHNNGKTRNLLAPPQRALIGV